MKSSRIVIVAFAAAAFAGIVSGAGGAQTGGDAPLAGADSLKAQSDGGAQVYGEICAACHMADAKGATGAGAIPALASNAHLADPAYPLNRVLHGKGGMPAFAELLTPEQIAQVITYVRSHFGNDYKPAVTVDDVKKAAAAPAA